ncbi:MAG: tetratricopeptide repeat protein [Desulfurivibrionaceae bacterium]|jgi:tetratricopeptide (TPR) repeat protein
MVSVRKKIEWCIFGFFVLAALAGAVPPANAASLETLRPGYEAVYRPEARPGVTFDSAKKDFEESLQHLQLYPDICPALSLYVDKTTVQGDRIEIGWTNHCGGPQKTGVFVLPTYKIANSEIVVEYRKEGHGSIRHEINFPDLVSLQFDNLAAARKAADALLFMQNEEKKADEERNARLTRFAPVAAQYRALKVKPAMSEEQRRVVVQANALNDRKEYAKAISLYQKAIEVDPVSYPQAYFNLALLSAQVQRFKPAIAYMKQYLLLAPDAKDARAAQDKIYEWEAAP